MSEPSEEIDLRMIDFAHTFTMEENDIKDDGYLFGLNNLINMFEQIAQERKESENQTPAKL